MIRTQINLTEQQYRQLQLEARRKAKSLSAIIRGAVDKNLANTKKGNTWILLEMSKKAGRSGDKYLAQNYKQYLYGAKSKYARYVKKSSK